jgi:hypothetical protein
MLDKSQGDIRSEDYKHDLEMQALISAVIAVAQALEEINRTMRNQDLVQIDKVRS